MGGIQLAFTLQAACLSHIGNRRGNNEDNFFFNGICLEEEHTSTHDPLLMERVLQEDVCLGVFDGMGGENYGEQASFTAASEMQALTGKPKLFYQSGGKYLGNLALALNDAVFRRAQELMTSRMGTTMAALYFSGSRVYVCNVGDSRVYRLRDHVFAQLSQDHVSTRIPAPRRKAPLTQHLGMNPEDVRIEPFVIKDSMQSGDIYLMCSDGLTDMVDNLALSDILSRSENPEQCALNLLQAALDGGGKDNITIKSDKPVYVYFQNTTKHEVYIHGIKVTTPKQETTGIANIQTQGTTAQEVYTIDGVKVGNTLKGQKQGLYIVKQGNNIKKVIK